MDRISPNFVNVYIFIRYVGIALFHILLICNRVIALDGCQNFVSAQYLSNIAFLQHKNPYASFMIMCAIIILQKFNFSNRFPKAFNQQYEIMQ